MNYLLHFEGNKKDFELWKALGLTDLDVQQISRYVEKNPPIGVDTNTCDTPDYSSIFQQRDDAAYCLKDRRTKAKVK